MQDEAHFWVFCANQLVSGLDNAIPSQAVVSARAKEITPSLG